MLPHANTGWTTRLSPRRWCARNTEQGADAAVWRVAAVSVGMGVLATAMEMAEPTVLRHDATAFFGARCALFLSSGWLALRAARACLAFLTACLARAARPHVRPLLAAGLGLLLLAAPLVTQGSSSPPTSDPPTTPGDLAEAVDVHFVSHLGPSTDARVLARSIPIVAVSAGRRLVWVHRDGVRYVAPADTFPTTTHVMMDEGASVADFVTAADVAIAGGAHEVVMLLPHADGVPSRLSLSELRRVNAMLQRMGDLSDRSLGALDESNQEEEAPLQVVEAPSRPACTPMRYGLSQAMTGAVTQGPVTVRAVTHPSQASPGVPWTDQLGPLGGMTLTEVLQRRLTVRLQRWSPQPLVLAPRALMVAALLAGLALGVALFVLGLALEAAAAERLTRSRGAPRGGAGRLRGPLGVVVAAMLTLSGALLVAL